MFKLAEIDSFACLQDRVVREALRHSGLVEEWTRMERALGGTEALKAAAGFAARHEEMLRPDRTWLREMQERANGRAAISEAMEWVTGQAAQKEAAAMLKAMNGNAARRLYTDRMIAEAAELNAVRYQLREQALGYVTFRDLAEKAERDRFALAMQAISPEVPADWALDRAAMLQAPWILERAPARSFEAFAVVSKIARAVEETRSLVGMHSSYLRTLIGSWAPDDPVAFAQADKRQRARGWAHCGIDARAFDLPRGAFPEVARATGLAPAPARVRATSEADRGVLICASGSLSDDASVQVRSIERMLRRELRERMPRHFGSNWIVQRVPAPMRREWEARREKTRRGMCIDLLDHSYFGDLVQIIMQKGVWEIAFKPYVGMSKEEFQISTNRLVEIRNVVDHAGELEVVEFILCFSEVAQIRRAFGLPNDGDDAEQ